MPPTATAEPLNVSDEARQLAAGLLQTPDKAHTRAHYEAMAAQATVSRFNSVVGQGKPATLTTPDIRAFAAQLMAQARAQALAHHAAAVSNAGSAKAEHNARCIDIVRGWADEGRSLAALCSHLGDFAAADAISGELDATIGQMIDMAFTARMLSIPGWDLATRSFKPEATA